MRGEARLARDVVTGLGYYTAGLPVLVLGDVEDDRVLVCLHAGHPRGLCYARVMPRDAVR